MTLQERVKQEIRIVQDFPKPGISFKDFSPLFQNPELTREVIKNLASAYRDEIDMVCGIESRGFILGMCIAQELDVPFVMVRKKGKLPPPVISESYALEYCEATLEIVEGQIPTGANIMIHDDVLATGGTAKACAELIHRVGANPFCYTFLIELQHLNGRKAIGENIPIHTIVTYEN